MLLFAQVYKVLSCRTSARLRLIAAADLVRVGLLHFGVHYSYVNSSSIMLPAYVVYHNANVQQQNIAVSFC